MANEKISISEIRAPRRPRTDSFGIKLLSESLIALGGEFLQSPVVVRKGDGYQLVCGASRIAAAKEAGLAEVECKVLPYLPDSPQARLAFIDENVIRTELSPAERDGWYSERKKLLAQIRPESTGQARMQAGKKKGGQTAGRGRPNSSTRLSGRAISPTVSASSRAQDEGARRRDEAAPSVWSLYAEGKLTQTQVDQLVQLTPSQQQAVAAEVVGKTVGETKAAVASMKDAAKQPGRISRRMEKCLTEVDAACRVLADKCAAALPLLDLHRVGGPGVHLTVSRLRIAVEAAQQLKRKLLGEEREDGSAKIAIPERASS